MRASHVQKLVSVCTIEIIYNIKMIFSINDTGDY